MDLLKVKIGELKTFCESSLFRQFSIKPVSPLRLGSYLNNPRADKDDTVLYLFVRDEKLIAFRTILPDAVQLQNKVVKFGWCSGVWVHPKYRGQKLSMTLLDQVMGDWQERLMFTNYSKSSESNYLSTGRFGVLQKRPGVRFYLYPNLNQLFKHRKNYNKLRFVLPFLSLSIVTISFMKTLIYSSLNVKSNYIEMEDFDQECVSCLKKSSDTFFGRKEKELDWIIRYPWVTQLAQKELIYPFSYSKKNYSLKVVKLIEKNQFVGFFVYTIVDSKMKILYYFVDENHLNLMIRVVSRLARKNRIHHLTILDTKLAQLFKKKDRCFALSKYYSSHIYTSFDISNADKKIIFDGDGDNCFT